MLLILTDSFDVHADIVIEKLKKENISFFRFNLDVESLKKTYISFEKFVWKIRFDNYEVHSNQFKCVWCRRPFVELSLEEQSYKDVDFKIWKSEWNKTLLGLYNTLKDIPWLNPLRKAYKGENKYYQFDIAKKVGFNMPQTLISNDKNAIKEFANNHQKVLFKLMSQEIYDLGDGNFKGLYTNVITKEEINNFNESEENPIVLQEYIDKKYEVRYTVVGKEHLVCRIDSQLSSKACEDWRRYDIANTPHYKIDAPEEIRNKVDCMMELLGLEYGALDFIVTDANKWFFLEINCLGQWLWIEQLTGLPISQAIIRWIKENNNFSESQ
jgi:glutathione synthase/RimK-type ligase-like ATP-grasp enzyme